MKVSECRVLSFPPESCARSPVGRSLIKHSGFQRPLLHSAGSSCSCSERSCSALLFIYYPSCFPLFSNPIIFCNPFTRHHLHQIIWRCIVSGRAWCLPPLSLHQFITRVGDANNSPVFVGMMKVAVSFFFFFLLLVAFLGDHSLRLTVATVYSQKGV